MNTRFFTKEHYNIAKNMHWYALVHNVLQPVVPCLLFPQHPVAILVWRSWLGASPAVQHLHSNYGWPPREG